MREYYDEEFLVRMTAEQKRQLVQAAATANEPLAVFIRTAIAERIDKEARRG